MLKSLLHMGALLVGPDGASHRVLEDMALMRGDSGYGSYRPIRCYGNAFGCKGGCSLPWTSVYKVG